MRSEKAGMSVGLLKGHIKSNRVAEAKKVLSASKCRGLSYAGSVAFNLRTRGNLALGSQQKKNGTTIFPRNAVV